MYWQKPFVYHLYWAIIRGLFFWWSQLQYAHALSWLLISEIYADGTEEWIEIVNLGPDSFSGIITFSWVKATPVTIPVSLLPNQVTIIGDEIPWVIDPSCTWPLGLALQINDNSPFTVHMMSWSTILDSFVAPSTPIKRASIQRQRSWATRTTVVSDMTNATNTQFHIDASPCVSALIDPITPMNRSSRVPSDQTQGLILSEILWDGSAEYIELLNQWPTDFS